MDRALTNVIASFVVGVAIVAVVVSTTGKKVPNPAPKQEVSTPALTPEQQKKKAFESSRALYGYLLTQQIKKSAFDEDALKIKSPQYYSNGVCVEANGKNRFGAYVGWKEYCYLVENNTWKLVEPT
jgi:hypothetical protein